MPAMALPPRLNSYDGLRVDRLPNGVLRIRMNRPQRYNAITLDMMQSFTAALNYASEDPDIVLTVVTGSGDYFSSGNDLANFNDMYGRPVEKVAEAAKMTADLVVEWAKSMIDHAKPLIAIVNGPGIGGGFTLLALCDFVYANDKFIGSAPFTSIGQCPELCSTYTFPLIMGSARASEILLGGRPLPADEAERIGYVTKVFPSARLDELAWKEIDTLLKLPPKTLAINKQLMRDVHREQMHRAIEREMATIEKMWTSDECAKAISDFFQRRQN